MDKGLDIETLRCVLALHGALHPKPRDLTRAIDALLRRRESSDSAVPLARTTEELSRQYHATAAWAAAEAGLHWRAADRSILCRWLPGYPDALAAVADAPPILFVHGRAASLGLPQIGIVGSRDATPGGCDTAFGLAGELAAAGFSIVSGMARGIDGAAHRGAIRARGTTIAVLGCGIDRVYPRVHEELAASIAANGALVSELPLGVPPLKQNFPARNRIISGLAAGLVVVEANLSSGSLITAQFALEHGREVFAVPGSIRNPWSRGCHALLRQGAHLVESAADVIAALPGYVVAALHAQQPAQPAAREARKPDPLQRAVLKALGFEPTGVDILVERTGLTMNRLSSILLTLEMSGAVRSLPGGCYERIDAQGHS